MIVVDTQQGIDEVLEYLQDKEYVAYDSETTGLEQSSIVIGISISADENTAYYIILKAYQEDRLQTIITNEQVLPVLKLLQTKQLICHNAIFDCIMSESYFKVSLIEAVHTDTLILAHLLNENRRIGLKELSKAYFGEDSAKEQAEMKASVLANGGKLTKTQYEMYKCDSHIMAKYGAKDALLTYKLFLMLVPELYEQGLDKFFYEEESMPLLKGSTYQLNITGLKVDQQALTTLKKTLEAECLEAKTFIYKEIESYIKVKYPGTNKKNTFNIGSVQQLSWLVFGQMGLEFNLLTESGKELCSHLGIKIPYNPSAKRLFIARSLFASSIAECNRSVGNINSPEAIANGKVIKAKKIKEPWAYIACDKKALQKHADNHKWIAKLLEYQRKNKILNTYVKGIESRIQYGIIRPNFLQSGTTSGRYSSRNPNFQNLPRDDKRIKHCICARRGRLYVGSDYSQLEPRVFAYLSGDARLLKAFDGNSDFYSVIGMQVYAKSDCSPQKDGSPEAFGVKYKKLRDLSKVIALASTYGATANQLASTTGKSVQDTQQDIDNYFEEFPKVREFQLESHKEAKETGQVLTIFGRPRRMPEAKNIVKHYGNKSHADLPYEIRNILNLSVNHRVQGTSASIVNRAAIRFNSLCIEAGIDCKLVIQVHDSLVAECNEADAEAVALLLQEAMENTTILPGIKLEAIPKIGRTLAEV